MAEFNPKVDSVGSNNYINYSERYGGNQAWGTLFEGLAKGADQQVQKGIKKQVDSAVEQANNDYFNINNITDTQNGAPGNGVEVGDSGGTVTRAGTSTPGGTDPNNLPKAVRDGGEVINHLGKAYENGTYSETNYWSQLNAKVKALKAQYPGYSDDIDQMVANATNNPTANQLRKSLYDDWNARASASTKAVDNDYKFLTEDSHIGYLGDELRQKALTRTMTADEIAEAKVVIGNNVAHTESVKRLKDDYELGKDINADKQDKAVRYGSAAVNNMFSDVYLKGFGATGKAYADFNQKIKDFMSDGNVDENEVKQIQEMRSGLIAELQKQYSTLINEPDSNGLTLNKVLLPDQLTALDKRFNDQLAILDTPLGGAEGVKGLGVLQISNTLIQAGQNTSMYTTMHTDAGEAAMQVGNLSKLSNGTYNATIQNTIDGMSNNGTNPVSAALMTVFSNAAVGDGTAIATSAAKAGNSVSAPQKAAAVSGAVKVALKTFQDPNSPIEQRVNAMSSLYGEGNTDFLRMVSDKPGKDGWTSRQRTWLELSSPAAAAAAAELEKTKPGSLQQYYNFLQKSAAVVFKDSADTTQATVDFAKYANVTLDAATGQLKVDIDTSKFKNPEAAKLFLQGRQVGQVSGGHGPAGPAPLAIGDQVELSKVKDGIDAVHRMNIIFQGMLPALDAMGVKPQDRTQAFLDIMGGIKLNNEKQTPTLDVIYNFLTKPSGTTGKTYDNPRNRTIIKDNLTPSSSSDLQLEGNGMIDTTFADHMATADVPYNKTVGGSKDFNKKTPLLMSKLTSDLGLSNEQAAGLVGNLAHESGGLNPSIKGDSGNAHGWAQWNGPRQKDMIKWTTANGYDPNSDDGNYAYLIHDLQVNYPKALENLKKAKTIDEATQIIQDQYEFPGNPMYKSRRTYADQAMAAVQSQ